MLWHTNCSGDSMGRSNSSEMTVSIMPSADQCGDIGAQQSVAVNVLFIGHRPDFLICDALAEYAVMGGHFWKLFRHFVLNCGGG
jgi:hypothetical protein